MKTYNKIKTEIIADFYLDEICCILNVEKSQVMGKLRTSELADIRAMICYLTKLKFSKAKLQDIADFFGQTHSTVKHSINKIEDLMKYDVKIKNIIGFFQLQDFESGILESHGFVKQRCWIATTALSKMVAVSKTPENKWVCSLEVFNTEHFFIENIDIFDAIILLKNIDSNPLGVLINSLKN